MSDYSVTMDNIRDNWVNQFGSLDGRVQAEVIFDRAMAAHDREVVAEALRDAADVAQGEESGGSATGYGDYYAARLRDRADRIERGE